MMIFAWVIIIISLAVCGTIVFKKFPQLSNVDVENLPQEKEAQKKKEILSRRVAADRQEFMQRWRVRLQPVGKWWQQIQLSFRKYVGKIERLWHHEEHAKGQPLALAPSAPVAAAPEDKGGTLLQEARQQLERGAYEKAETLFIAVIKQDPHSAAAYRGLGDTYFAQGALAEAEETYSFLHQLSPEDDMVLAKLGEVSERRGNVEKAIDFYQQAAILNDSLAPRFYHLAELLTQVGQPVTAKEAIIQAVELDPKNPNYLDLLAEIGILCGDKDLVEQAYNELRIINPKNEKLPGLFDRLKSLR